MSRRLFAIARADRRDVIVAFVVLLGVLFSHAMLETARDAMFLARLPASRLPWVYIGIAAGALGVVWLNERALERWHKRRLLQATLVIAALVTAGFWFAADYTGTELLYVFYIWTGLVATVSVAQFWVLMADRFTVASAKRAYAVIGAGALVGATAGSAAAGAIVQFLEPAGLLLCSPAVLLVTAGLAGLLPADTPAAAASMAMRAQSSPRRGSLRELFEHPYLFRLLLLVLATTITVTAVDLTFKAVVASEVAPEDLGSFFAIFYAALNGVGLVVQLVAASRVIRSLGVNRSLMVLPFLLLSASLGFALTGAVVLVLLLKGFDGMLRHSIHRTGSEVLYVPVPRSLRARSKVFIDGVGARGGQAVAALGVLGALALGSSPLHLAIAVGVCAVLWLVVVVSIHPHYLELFRRQLRAGSIEHRVEVPDLDLHSLETLLAALNSEDERMVSNALDLLEHNGRGKLIPALILYHPSTDVVLRALDIFVAEERTDFVPVARRLLHAVDPRIRAAALRAVIAIDPEEQALRGATRDSSDEVRSTALIGLTLAGLFEAEEFRTAIRDIAGGASAEARLALARAIPSPAHPELAWAIERLAEVPEPALWSALASTIAAEPDSRFLPVLLPMLAARASRPAARGAFIALGNDALEFLENALFDSNVPESVRAHIPRTVSRFGGDRAAELLLRHMHAESEGRAAYKSLRGLGRMVADDSELSIDRAQVRDVALVTTRRALTILAWRMNLERQGRARPERATHGAEMLIQLLQEKERGHIERVFRLFGLLHPEEDFERIYAGLFSDDPESRASGRELLENIIEEPVRSAVLALSDSTSDSIRLLEAQGFFRPLLYSYEEQLAVMLRDHSDAVRALAAHHVGELGLDALADELMSVKPSEAGVVEEALSRALEILGLDTKAPAKPRHAN